MSKYNHFLGNISGEPNPGSLGDYIKILLGAIIVGGIGGIVFSWIIEIFNI